MVPLQGDIPDEACCNKLVSDAAAQLDGLDILVNNAARRHAVANLKDTSAQQFDCTFRTDVYAVSWITRAALRI